MKLHSIVEDFVSVTSDKQLEEEIGLSQITKVQEEAEIR